MSRELNDQWLSADAERSLFAECEAAVEGFHGCFRKRQLFRSCKEFTQSYVDQGITDKDLIVKNVREDMLEKYGSIVLTALILALVQFLVLKLLRYIWPDEPRWWQQAWGRLKSFCKVNQ